MVHPFIMSVPQTDEMKSIEVYLSATEIQQQINIQ